MDMDILKRAVMDSRDGITISRVGTGGNPLIFVNPAFERMTGYESAEATGHDCRYLQNQDRDQPALVILRQAIASAEHCLVTLRNYRKDGSLFWNELSLSPILDGQGVLTNFIGIQKDVTERVMLHERMVGEKLSLEREAEQLATLAFTDGLTGIYNRRFFDTQLAIQGHIAQRTGLPLSLIILDVDHFHAYNTAYGHPGGDDALRQVAGKLNLSFTRASDFVARYGGEEFAVVSTGLPADKTRQFAEALCDRIRKLRIPHVGSPTGFLTLSAGYAVHPFDTEDSTARLVAQADRALYLAKAAGRDRAMAAPVIG